LHKAGWFCVERVIPACGQITVIFQKGKAVFFSDPVKGRCGGLLLPGHKFGHDLLPYDGAHRKLGNWIKLHDPVRTPMDISQSCIRDMAQFRAYRKRLPKIADNKRGKDFAEQSQFLTDVRLDVSFLEDIASPVCSFDKGFPWNASDRPIVNVRQRTYQGLIAFVASEMDVVLLRIEGLSQDQGADDMCKSHRFPDKKDTLLVVQEYPLAFSFFVSTGFWYMVSSIPFYK